MNKQYLNKAEWAKEKKEEHLSASRIVSFLYLHVLKWRKFFASRSKCGVWSWAIWIPYFWTCVLKNWGLKPPCFYVKFLKYLSLPLKNIRVSWNWSFLFLAANLWRQARSSVTKSGFPGGENFIYWNQTFCWIHLLLIILVRQSVNGDCLRQWIWTPDDFVACLPSHRVDRLGAKFSHEFVLSSPTILAPVLLSSLVFRRKRSACFYLTLPYLHITCRPCQ